MEHFHYTLSELETLGDSLPELKAMGMLNAKRGMVNIFGDTLRWRLTRWLTLWSRSKQECR